LPEDIDPRELLLLEEGHCLRSQIMNLCELRHRWVSRLSYETGSLETLVRLVASGNGVTILPALAAELLSDEQKERIFPFHAPAPVREVSLAVHRNFLKRDLIDALGEEVRAGVPAEFHIRGESTPVSLHQ
jgi:LysR family hydrogen peroxide-inducible transcriptional activator